MSKRILPAKQLKKSNQMGKRKLAQSLPQWWQKKNLGKEPVQVCERCHAVYYDEHWHSWQSAKSLADFLRKESMAKETLCTECAYIKKGHDGVEGYEGDVLLHGLSDPREKIEILNLIRNIGSRASSRDPEDQIIKIEDKGETVRVTTTENQLAVSIGKQVARAHKGGKLEIKFSSTDELARVVWTRK